MQNKEIFLIPYSHLDTQWRWEYPTTIKKYIKNTIDENLILFEKYPHHRFNFTGAIRYAMMKDYYPEGFAEVKRLIADGRWALAGTCLDETDALVPSSESMIRNILYGHRWQMREFGRSSRDYMIPDCFGFPGNMPTVLAHCGIHGFSSNKLTWGSAVGIPFEIGVWEGPDGSGIVSALNPCRYDSRLFPVIPLNPGRLARLKRLGRKNGVWKSFQYYGVGDIGGAPTEGSVKRALASMRYYAGKAGGMTVRQGSADEFFAGITAAERGRMDRYRGDFLLTNHSAGTITSAAIMKRWNRMNEQAAFAAEAASLAALLFAGQPYPSDKIGAAWTRMIAGQMHDILPGTSTPTAYEYAHNDEVTALKTWDAILEDAAGALAPRVKGDGGILLFNALAQERRDPVDLVLDLPATWSPGLVSLESWEGDRYPGELKKNEDGEFHLTFIPSLAPVSWTRFSLREAAKTETSPDDPVVLTRDDGGYFMENSLYRVGVSAAGLVYSVYHRILDRELLQKPLAYEFQREKPRQFPAWNMDWRDRRRAPFKRIEGGSTVEVREEGPLRVTLRVTATLGDSRLVREISLAAGAEQVDFTEKIRWRETGCSLKLAVTAALENPVFTTNRETSRVDRDVNHKKIFEVPSRLWADLSGGGYGLSLLEDSKYGWDRPAENTIRMTLLYTPAVRLFNGFRDQKYHDWGDHTVRYALYGHEGDWRGTDKPARAFNQPVRAFQVKTESSSRTRDAFSLVRLSTDQLGVMALKKSEEDDSIILRLYEREGRRARGTVAFPFPVRDVFEVNGLEEPTAPVAAQGSGFEAVLEPNGIRAFRVNLEKPTPPASPGFEPLPLEHNCRLFGRNGEAGEALFPREITPERLRAGGMEFVLTPDEDFNALGCAGQSVAVSRGFNTLSLLAGAEKGREALFQWLDGGGLVIGRESLHVSSFTGFAGQWDRRIWQRPPRHHLKNRRDYAWLNRCIGVEPGFINGDRFEWAAGHTHRNGEDQPYRLGYLYHLVLPVPEGAASLVLPGTGDGEGTVYLAAATLWNREAVVKGCRLRRDKFDF